MSQDQVIATDGELTLLAIAGMSSLISLLNDTESVTAQLFGALSLVAVVAHWVVYWRRTRRRAP